MQRVDVGGVQVLLEILRPLAELPQRVELTPRDVQLGLGALELGPQADGLGLGRARSPGQLRVLEGFGLGRSGLDLCGKTLGPLRQFGALGRELGSLRRELVALGPERVAFFLEPPLPALQGVALVQQGVALAGDLGQPLGGGGDQRRVGREARQLAMLLFQDLQPGLQLARLHLVIARALLGLRELLLQPWIGAGGRGLLLDAPLRGLQLLQRVAVLALKERQAFLGGARAVLGLAARVALLPEARRRRRRHGTAAVRGDDARGGSAVDGHRGLVASRSRPEGHAVERDADERQQDQEEQRVRAPGLGRGVDGARGRRQLDGGGQAHAECRASGTMTENVPPMFWVWASPLSASRIRSRSASSVFPMRPWVE